MLLQHTDFNGADNVITTVFKRQWQQFEQVLRKMPLHLKASDQARIQGTPIFDPVETNQYIKQQLGGRLLWDCNLPIPAPFRFLGTDVDFVSNGLLIEIQFSNYPFLLNNTVRCELFYKSKTLFSGKPIEAAIVVTKAKMFPASNSTLYYEQAANQLQALSANRVFDIPIRLVGLFERIDRQVSVRYSTYSTSRYSRTVSKRVTSRCTIRAGRTAQSRCTLEFNP